MYTDEELLDALRGLASELGRTPSGTDINSREDIPSEATYHRRFDSYVAACEMAGLEPNKRGGREGHDLPTEDILRDIRRFAVEHGRIPRTSDFDECDGLPASQTIISRFDGVAEALGAAMSWSPTVEVDVDRPREREQLEVRPGEEKSIRDDTVVVSVRFPEIP